MGELLAYAHNVWIERNQPKEPLSKQRSVLLIPGFMASDLSLYPLAKVLRAAGHEVTFGGIWCNADCPRVTLERLEAALRRAAALKGGKVVIIGHSLGGIYARELARRHPDLVERAVLLGSPLRDLWENSSPWIRLMATGVIIAHGHRDGCTIQSHELCGIQVEGSPPTVPETIVYSKSDGVVRWESCIESGESVEAIEVDSSHCGMGCNPDVLKIILDRLDQPVRPLLSVAATSTRPVHRPGSRRRPLLKLVRASRSQSVA